MIETLCVEVHDDGRIVLLDSGTKTVSQIDPHFAFMQRRAEIAGEIVTAWITTKQRRQPQ